MDLTFEILLVDELKKQTEEIKEINQDEYEQLLLKARDALADQIPEIVKDVIKMRNVNIGYLAEKMVCESPSTGRVCVVLFANPSRARVRWVDNNEEMDIASTSQLIILYNPKTDKNNED